jgi:hypothetical protein
MTEKVPQYVRDLYDECAKAVEEAQPKPDHVIRRGKRREIKQEDTHR